MTTFNLPTYNLDNSIVDAQSVAELVRADAAKIVTGGMNTAREYARALYAKRPTQYWHRVEHNRAEQMIERTARDALACAEAIEAKGAAWFVKGEILAVATLTADASAGPVGFIPLFNIEAHAE